MAWITFRPKSRSCLGVDIGTSSIKIIELSHWRKRNKLENYGEIPLDVFSREILKNPAGGEFGLSDTKISRAILAILNEAKITAKRAVFTLPDYTSFFTWFELPPMKEEEVPNAVKYEARRHIPFPLSEVTLDWQVIEKKVSDKKEAVLKILLVSVPNEVINQYKRIASLVNLEVLGIEAEVFGLSRALIKRDRVYPQEESPVVAIVDIGSQSTTVSIVEGGVLKRSHSFDIAGNEFTMLLTKSLNKDFKTAEELKQKYGLLETPPEGEGILDEKATPSSIRKVLLPLVDLVLTEIEKICQNFYQTERKNVQKIILAGGSAFIPGLRDYFSEHLGKPLELADPFADIFYPPILNETLKEMGPSYAIAVGAALRGLEQ